MDKSLKITSIVQLRIESQIVQTMKLLTQILSTLFIQWVTEIWTSHNFRQLGWFQFSALLQSQSSEIQTQLA